jgi:PAS domain S-box-containing protein
MKEQSKLTERTSSKSLTLSSVSTAQERSFAGTPPVPRFGFFTEEALGQSVDLIIPEHPRAAHWNGFDAAMAKSVTKLQGRPTLTRALHKSGRRLYVEMTFAIIKGDAESEVFGSVSMARDVTERVERERSCKPIILEDFEGSSAARNSKRRCGVGFWH